MACETCASVGRMYAWRLDDACDETSIARCTNCELDPPWVSKWSHRKQRKFYVDMVRHIVRWSHPDSKNSSHVQDEVEEQWPKKSSSKGIMKHKYKKPTKVFWSRECSKKSKQENVVNAYKPSNPAYSF